MVDFDNETTVGMPAVDVERILILERRYNLFEALEKFNRARMIGAEGDMSIVRSRLFSMFLEIDALLARQMKETEFNKLKDQVIKTEASEQEMLEAVTTINKILDKVQLTRIDTRIRYDSTRVEVENQHKSL